MSKRNQPNWSQPQGIRQSKLYLFNSLTRSKCEFVPLKGNYVTWYNCGPTVYDQSHMGHARNYISVDVIRRILQNYFNYDIFFVQNVTDIDDKIIRRARQNHLFEEYHKRIVGTNDFAQLKKDINSALNQMKIRIENENDPDKKNLLVKMVQNCESTLNSNDDLSKTVSDCKDIMSDWLDREYGDKVTDNSIFSSLPKKYEDEYNEDMKKLNVLPPDCVTRVSEYISEIIEYIKVIITNGYAYESNGSIYFDTDKFNSQDKHFYAKIVPEAFGDSKALSEGEGDLSAALGEKRSPNDFALWKASKPGEPMWNSPWGFGRPGWHIECSVMASTLFGSQIDIHSGGYDLKFPHHDNEMAQAEAYYDTGKPWINYFLHSGHLTISGCKMSKSLKNFISIKDALKMHTPRQLRILFLLHFWKDTLDYSENSMHDAIQYEKTINEFFLNIKDLIRRSSTQNDFDKWTDLEIELNKKYHFTISAVHTALCDNIDTKTACDEVRNLITSCNTYNQTMNKSGSFPNVLLLKNIALYVTKLFRIFGAINTDEGVIGFDDESNESYANKEEIVMPFLEVIADLREQIRDFARELKNNELLKISDDLRDNKLVELGVKMEDLDIGGGKVKTCLKLVDRETLIKEREEKLKLEEKKRIEKEKKRLERERLEEEKNAQRRIPPNELFKNETDKYSAFDQNGIPTHDHQGKELSKGQVKKLTKLYQKQQEKYNEYLKSITNGEDQS